MIKRRDFRYRRFGETSSGLELNCVRYFLAILMLIGATCLCYAAYSASYQEMESSHHHGQPDQNSSRSGVGKNLTGQSVNSVSGPEGEIGKQVQEQNDKVENNPEISETTEIYDTTEISDTTEIYDTTDIYDSTEVTEPAEVTYEEIQREALNDSVPESHKLTREMIKTRIEEVVSNIRNGRGDTISMQFILQLLQAKLKKMGEESDVEDDEDNKHLQSVSSSDEEVLIKDSPLTLKNPRIRNMLRRLSDSPSVLDVYDLNKSLLWDFRCLFIRLGLRLEPAICIDTPDMDTWIANSLSDSDTWEHRMLRSYIEILKSDSGLQAVDLGSSLGLYSLTAAALGRYVLAVEPKIQNILPFHKAVILNNFQTQVTLVTNALSNTYKLVQLIYDRDDKTSVTKTVDITEAMLMNDVIDPNDVIRTVTLNDLYPAMIYKKAVLMVDVSGDETAVFQGAMHFFKLIDVRYVFICWQFTDNPKGYNFIADFLTERNYMPKHSPNGKSLSDSDMKMDHPFIIWVKHLNRK